MIKIEKTTNYGKFKSIRGNREINRVHLNKLCNSILENNLLEANPIIVNEKFQVLDGQHRLLAAEKLGLPIYYVLTPNGAGSIAEVQMLNSNLRVWSMLNYLNSYVARGNSDYVELQNFTNNTGLSLGIAILLFSGAQSKGRTGNNVINSFKDGTFQATFKDFAYDTYKALTSISKYCDDNSWNDREFVSVLVMTQRAGIKSETLLLKLDTSGIRVPRLATRRQYIRFFEDVLSYKAKTPVRLI